MKSLSTLTIVTCACLLFTHAASAQSPLPPPPPLIYKAPVKSDLKEFAATDGTYKITFPCSPKRTETEIESAVVTETKCNRQGSNSAVRIWSFGSVLDNSEGQVYDLFSKSILNTSKLKIVGEEDIDDEKLAIREYDTLSGYLYGKIRVIVDGQRIYELRTDVTNWHIINENTKSEFFAEAGRFFDSFILAEVQDAGISGVPVEILGTATNTHYTNTFFDFSIEVPEGWKVLTEEEVGILKGIGIDSLSNQNKKKEKALRDLVNREVMVLSVATPASSNGRFSSLGIGVQKQPSISTKALDVAKVTNEYFVKNHNYEVTSKTRETKINGKTFATYSMRRLTNGVILNQKFYCLVAKGFSASFVISYVDSDHLKQLDDLIINMKTAKK